MNAGGWFSMIVSVGGMTAFFFLCILKVVRTPSSTEHLHSQRDTPKDVEQEREGG